MEIYGEYMEKSASELSKASKKCLMLISSSHPSGVKSENWTLKYLAIFI